MLEMLKSLFKTPVSVFAKSNFVLPDELYPEERQYVQNASSGRRSEFATGRHCARMALQNLGIPWAPIQRRSNGAPEWPNGFIGSISHCENFCVSAVTTTDRALSIGIDVEINSVLPACEAELICTEQEIYFLKSQSGRSFHEWVNLSFSAKESFFKCYFPLTELFFTFHDARVSFSSDESGHSGDFSITVHTIGGPKIRESTFLGRWHIDSERVYTGVTCMPVETHLMSLKA